MKQDFRKGTALLIAEQTLTGLTARSNTYYKQKPDEDENFMFLRDSTLNMTQIKDDANRISRSRGAEITKQNQ